MVKLPVPLSAPPLSVKVPLSVEVASIVSAPLPTLSPEVAPMVSVLMSTVVL